MTCDGSAPVSASKTYIAGDQWIIAERFSLDSGTRCADVTIYKPAPPGTTYIFSQGYDVSCDAVGGARFVSRGIQAHY